MFLEEHEQGEGGLNFPDGITSSFGLVVRRLHVGRRAMHLERQADGMEE